MSVLKLCGSQVALNPHEKRKREPEKSFEKSKKECFMPIFLQATEAYVLKVNETITSDQIPCAKKVKHEGKEYVVGVDWGQKQKSFHGMVGAKIGKGGCAKVKEFEVEGQKKAVKISLKKTRPSHSSALGQPLNDEQRIRSLCTEWDILCLIHQDKVVGGIQEKYENIFCLPENPSRMVVMGKKYEGTTLNRKKFKNAQSILKAFQVPFEGMAYCAGKGIANLDIKESNVLVVSSEEKVELYISDWGLAKYLPESLPDLKQNTNALKESILRIIKSCFGDQGETYSAIEEASYEQLYRCYRSLQLSKDVKDLGVMFLRVFSNALKQKPRRYRDEYAIRPLLKKRGMEKKTRQKLTNLIEDMVACKSIRRVEAESSVFADVPVYQKGALEGIEFPFLQPISMQEASERLNGIIEELHTWQEPASDLPHKGYGIQYW